MTNLGDLPVGSPVAAGTAATLTPGRTLDGQAFDGSTNITVIAPGTHAATSKTTPADADELPLVDSAASNVLKKLTWANLKATLKTYLDTLYFPITGSVGGDLTGALPNPTLGTSGVSAATYGDSTHYPIVTFDAKGRATSASNQAFSSGPANLSRSARSSNTILAASDKGTVVCATAAFTQTLTAAATLGAGWWVILKNDTQDGTTVLVVDPNSSETIDALATATMYSGETRLIECDGSNFFSQLLHGGYAKFAPTGGNFIVPAGVEQLQVVCVGSGGQGGGGYSSVGASGSGGAAGGGGATTLATIRGSDVTAGGIVTVTAAAGGSGAGAAGSPGSTGSDGAATTFGALLKAGGGGGGQAAASAASNTSGGGGSPVNSSVNITGGAPTSNTFPVGGASAAGTAGGSGGLCSEWGGASGGSSGINANTNRQGGSAIYGGPGGGPGGAVSGSAGVAAGAGGTTQSFTKGGGAAAGNSGASTTKGSDGVFVGPYCGSGGGGGGSGSTGVAGKDGGVGSIGAGGGGAGSSTNSTGGTGGAGGAGECRVWYS